MSVDLCITDAHIATMRGADLGVIRDGAVCVSGGRVTWVGPREDRPRSAQTVQVSARGGWVTPGLIDAHTHLVYAGSRAGEWAERLGGRSYASIAAAGGGIQATMRATREASVEALVEAARPRARALMADGVTTVEIKSGYGLTLESEARMLRAARQLGRELGLTVLTTFLGAHALPPEFSGRSDDYIDVLASEWLPALHAEGLVDHVDAYCEHLAFSAAQVARLFDAAEGLGLPIKLHAEQFTDQGGARLLAQRGGLSADHLEFLAPADAASLAAAGSVAVLLPAAFLHLRETQLPPIAALREAGVPMAVATDHNPGTAPLLSLRAALYLACTLFRLTPQEALRGAPARAALALGLADRGRIAPGQRADLCVWRVDDPAEILATVGPAPLQRVYLGGVEQSPPRP